MAIPNSAVHELHALQPGLTVIDNRILGCFYLSASLVVEDTARQIVCHPWNHIDPADSYIRETFDLDIEVDDQMYPVKVREKTAKILKWKEQILPRYWHVNSDNSLCLGVRADIIKKQQQRPFAEFINILLMEYFYYMCYVKQHQVEPWEAYKHGMFALLEFVTGDISVADQLRCMKVMNFSIHRGDDEWRDLLLKTKCQKIKGEHACPFCPDGAEKAMNCTMHRKQIRGYNELQPLIFF